MTYGDQMSDLLSAASVILTVSGILFGLWYGDLQRVIAETIPKHLPDRKSIQGEIRSALLGKAVPLAAFSVLASLIFLPALISVVVDALSKAVHYRLGALALYDAGKCSFVLVSLMTMGLAIYSSILVWQLERKRRKTNV